MLILTLKLSLQRWCGPLVPCQHPLFACLCSFTLWPMRGILLKNFQALLSSRDNYLGYGRGKPPFHPIFFHQSKCCLKMTDAYKCNIHLCHLEAALYVCGLWKFFPLIKWHEKRELCHHSSLGFNKELSDVKRPSYFMSLIWRNFCQKFAF